MHKIIFQPAEKAIGGANLLIKRIEEIAVAIEFFGEDAVLEKVNPLVKIPLLRLTLRSSKAKQLMPWCFLV